MVTKSDWPPADLALPDTLEGIEAGRFEQRGLFGEEPDDSRAGRLRRITTKAGGATAGKLPAPWSRVPSERIGELGDMGTSGACNRYLL